MMNKVLCVNDIKFSYDKTEVIHGVSFDLHEGEAITIIGANGAGKSTILNTIIGLQRVKSGEIYYCNENISHKSTQYLINNGLCLVPEGRQIFPAHTVEENLLLGAYSIKDKDFIDKKIAEMYDWFPRLKERSNQKAGTLSGGEQQMLAIARALMSNPKVLMLDEPSLGLAPIIIDEVFELLNEIKRKGVSILLVEQLATKALDFADRAYVLETGNIVLQGSSEYVKNDPNVINVYLGIKK